MNDEDGTLRRLTRIIQTCIATCAALLLQRIQYPRCAEKRENLLQEQ